MPENAQGDKEECEKGRNTTYKKTGRLEMQDYTAHSRKGGAIPQEKGSPRLNVLVTSENY